MQLGKGQQYRQQLCPRSPDDLEIGPLIKTSMNQRGEHTVSLESPCTTSLKKPHGLSSPIVNPPRQLLSCSSLCSGNSKHSNKAGRDRGLTISALLTARHPAPPKQTLN